MSDHVYKKIEVVGSSPNGFEEAIKNALARAEKTVRNMRWFEVTETRGDVENGKVGHWQVTLKIGFTLESDRSSVCIKTQVLRRAPVSASPSAISFFFLGRLIELRGTVDQNRRP